MPKRPRSGDSTLTLSSTDGRSSRWNLGRLVRLPHVRTSSQTSVQSPSVAEHEIVPTKEQMACPQTMVAESNVPPRSVLNSVQTQIRGDAACAHKIGMPIRPIEHGHMPPSDRRYTPDSAGSEAASLQALQSIHSLNDGFVACAKAATPMTSSPIRIEAQNVHPSSSIGSTSMPSCSSSDSSVEIEGERCAAPTYGQQTATQAGAMRSDWPGHHHRRAMSGSPTSLRPSPLFQMTPVYPLHQFEVLETLGTGTFGRVLLVRHRSCPRSNPHGYFALKVLNKQDIVRLKQVTHTNNERYILSRVHHPFIVTLHCTYQDEVNCYMLMEYVVGGEVFSHLRRARRFTVDVTRFYISCLVLALAYLHSEKVLYRDLKPENLLLDRHGYVKVADFGFAKELRMNDRTWTLCGTPEYLSPEVIQSQGQSFASDYWALGVLMYEMLCGFPPFFDSTPFATYEKILQGNVAFPKHVDHTSRDLILGFLTKDVSRRLGNLRGGAIDVMRHPWFEGVDWQALLEKRVPAPIVPVQSFAGDTGNFQKYGTFDMTDMPALRTPSPNAGMTHHPASAHHRDQGMFSDF